MSEKAPVVVLFADICGSTKLYDTMGDAAAEKLILECLSLLARTSTDFQGTVIKSMGDAVMCTFPSADLAVEAARQMHCRLLSAPAVNQSRLSKLNLHIGMHLGTVRREKGDVFGDTVNVAARMMALAKAGQTFTTGSTVATLDKETRDMVRRVDSALVKGKRKELDVYEVISDWCDLTIQTAPSAVSGADRRRLTLRFQGKVTTVDRSQTAITMGRHADNDVMVEDSSASRVHARIEYRRGKFVLIDESTNGTYLFIEGEEPARLHLEEYQLRQKGVIGLGRPVDPDSPAAIQFICAQ